ncbi:NADP-dependent oxidoreductase [Streptomyces sp. PT12]|uniref:NADP-dependent oxidoreductase n=1 Tax=Streptomyces sp. PT12 TaxID=1510197 RepID=UPI000DE3928A|nr:NADP-dependent oxidoreductase [Streptomyces sp. PT12]RBM06231.1 NADP-dependent oxidoreductase [Streptomyces sp. PT12]
MRAVQIDAHGGPERLTVREVPEPKAVEGELLVRTVASTLNPVDWKTRAWESVGIEPPATLGWDSAGVVVGGAVDGFAVGDRVFAMSAQVATGLGTWAELVSLPARLVAHAPATLTLPEAATLPLAGVTAVQALEKLRLKEGQRLLVTGGVGAVGGLAIQLARHAGIVVDTLVSRAEHVAEARALGAELVIDRPVNLPHDSYDGALDTAGVDVSAAVAPGGAYVSVSDEPLPDLPGAAKSYVQEDNQALARLAALVDAGELRTRVAAYHPVDEVRLAHERFEAGGLLGKVVLLF